eukprot:gb/GEZN01001119.1/.p1 GENE.gb/GEZN01001119.1/~~gb/GEZN01001119.1/.p1  ORF type:complete len:1045 (-),score=185.66 gb/GEZN01001119.1/:115-3249(-)
MSEGKSGMMKKSASSKKDDRVRDNWKERWFVVHGHNLNYYKKQDDKSPKGVIDLRAAKVEHADVKVGLPHTICIQQAKQIFTYLICNSQADQASWITALRKAAGYDDIGSSVGDAKAPADRSQALASFGVLMLEEGSNNPDRVVIYASLDHQINIVIEDQIANSYPAKNVISAAVAKQPDLNLRHVDRITSLYSVTVEFRDIVDKTVTKSIRKFFAPNLLQSEQLEKMLNNLSIGDFSLIRDLVKNPIKQTAHIQLGDDTALGNWVSRWAAVGEKRIMIFRRAESNLPSWVVEVPSAKISKFEKNGIKVVSGIETIVLKFTSTTIRDMWSDTLEEIQDEFPLEESEAKKAKVKDDQESDSDDDHLPPPDGAPPAGPVQFSGVGNCTHEFSPEEESYVACWGTNESGQMATPDGKSSAVPVLTPIIFKKKVRSIAAGHSHAGAVTREGHIYMWGDGREKQLGLGQHIKKSPRPSLLTSLIRKGKFAHLALGRVHSMAVTELGAVWVWGDNTFGQLGIPELSDGALYPTQLKGIFEFKQTCCIDAGGDTSAAILMDPKNDLYLWGANHAGQTGTGTTQTAVFTPTKITPLCAASRSKKDEVVQVSVGSACCAAVTKLGTLYTWGENKKGQLGVGTTRPRSLPGEVEWLKEHNMTILQVSCGNKHMIAQGMHEGSSVVLTWGSSVLNGFQEDQVLPAVVTQFENTKLVNASGTHSVTINNENKLFSFGINRFGELGNGKPGVQALVRVRFNKVCQTVSAACGVGFTVALLQGENPPQITSSHYAKKAAAEKSKPQGGGGMPRGMPKMPPMPGGGAGLDANAAIAALLNQFAIAPSDANAQMYHGMGSGGGIPGVFPGGGSAGGGGPDKDLPSAPAGDGGAKPKNKYAAMAKKATTSVPTVAVAMEDEDADDLLPAPPNQTDHEEYAEPVPQAKPQESERKAAAAAAAVEAKKAEEEAAAAKAAAAATEVDPDLPPQPIPDNSHQPHKFSAEVISPEEAQKADKEPKKKGGKKKPLPEGWKKVKDPRTGRHYYYNQATRETSWKRPGK